MKRLATLILALILTLSLCAFAESDALARIQEKGEIIIAQEGTWAPWTYHDESDNLTGFDYEVGCLIAEKLGVTATFIEGEWDGLFAGVDAGRYDLVINGVDYTPERAEKYDFSDPYIYYHTALIVRGDNEEITSFEDLAGKTTANTVSSTYAEMSEAYGGTNTSVDSLADTFELVLSGRVDATLNADMSYYDYMKEHPDANLKIVALSEEANQVVIPMVKGDDTATLREAINAALVELRADGTLAELSIKYFGGDLTE